MKQKITNFFNTLSTGYLYPFFIRVLTPFRRLIKDVLLKSAVQEIMQEQQAKNHASFMEEQKKSMESLPPNIPYIKKIEMITQFYDSQNYINGHALSKKELMKKLKNMTEKEVSDLFESLHDMFIAINVKKEFSFDKVKQEAEQEALYIQQQIDQEEH